MTIDLTQASKLAIEHLCDEYRRSITVIPSRLPASGVYNFDPNGWAIYVVEVNKAPWCVGGSQFVAVNLDTGETRSLGIIGE